jgi:hypothetical protein
LLNAPGSRASAAATKAIGQALRHFKKLEQLDPSDGQPQFSVTPRERVGSNLGVNARSPRQNDFADKVGWLVMKL